MGLLVGLLVIGIALFAGWQVYRLQQARRKALPAYRAEAKRRRYERWRRGLKRQEIT